jgi:hypothetical protein
MVGAAIDRGCIQTPREQTLAELASAYRAAKGDDAKRDVCIRAIDLGYIKVTAPLENVRALCGADFDEKVGTDPHDRQYGIVHFTPMQGVGRPPSAGSPYFVGWYLVVYYYHDQIDRYNLSNTHK